VAAGIWATRPDNPGLRRLGILYTVVGLASALVFPAHAWAFAAARPGSDLAGGTSAAWLGDWIWALGAPPLLCLGLLLYPDGGLPGRRWWPVAASGIVALALLAGGNAVDALPGTDSSLWSALGSAGFLLFLASAAAGLAALVLRMVRAPRGSDLRGQVGAFLLAALLAIGTAVIPDGNTATHLVLFLAAGVALPATVASAVVRRRLLDPQVALAARVDTLTAARTTLVTEREEERAMLRRELHDGRGPSLAAIGLGMRRLQSEVADPAEATLVTTLADEVQRAVGEVRRICEGLRPAALNELGLVAALSAAADRLGSLGGPSVTVEAGPLPALSPAHEVAAYRVAMEAATNAVRHAGAEHVDVRLCWKDGLVVDVEDDGGGIADGARPGVGLRAMADRADELGGSTTVAPRPGGGTVVRLRLPAGCP
jgi:signal transduction histidine kinase